MVNEINDFVKQLTTHEKMTDRFFKHICYQIRLHIRIFQTILKQDHGWNYLDTVYYTQNCTIFKPTTSAFFPNWKNTILRPYIWN